METTYPFRLDADWYNWGRSFKSQVLANAVAFNIPESTAAAIGSAYDAFATAYDLAVDPATRSKPKVDGKDEALADFKDAVRPTVRQLQYSDALSNEQRTELGIRNIDNTRTPSTLPAAAPTVAAFVTGTQTSRLEVRDPAAEDRRAKPAGVRQIEIHAFEGPTPPADPAMWPVVDLAGRTTVDFYYPDAASATTVWYACCWVSSRNERGPMSQPVRVTLGGTGIAGQAADTADDETGNGEAEMKIAA